MKLHIKNMVSYRCKLLVKDELTKLGLHYTTVELGEADIVEDFSFGQHEQFRLALLIAGLELIDNKKTILIQKIKNAVIELVHYSQSPLILKLSEYLSKKLDYDYTYLNNLFSTVQQTSIQQFFIAHKIERVKELLVYGELTLTEIAYQMHYSSVAHLSAQFKKVTNLTPSMFRQVENKKRCMLENV